MVIRPDLDRAWCDMEKDLAAVGAAAVRVMSPGEARYVAALVQDHPFAVRPNTYGPRSVVQNFRACEESSIPADSIVRRISKALEDRIYKAHEWEWHWFGEDFPVTEDFTLNDHLLLWYPECPLGLGPHRDHSKYKNLIVSITLRGESGFNIHESSETPPTRTFRVTPGMAVFMRAPGFLGEDIRPYHSVTDVGSERISLILKHKEV